MYLQMNSRKWVTNRQRPETAHSPKNLSKWEDRSLAPAGALLAVLRQLVIGVCIVHDMPPAQKGMLMQ